MGLRVILLGAIPPSLKEQPQPLIGPVSPLPVSVDTTRLGKGTTGSSPGHLTKVAKPCRIAEKRRNVLGEAICCCGIESPLPSGFS